MAGEKVVGFPLNGDELDEIVAAMLDVHRREEPLKGKDLADPVVLMYERRRSIINRLIDFYFEEFPRHHSLRGWYGAGPSRPRV